MISGEELMKNIKSLVATKNDTEKVYDAFLRRYRKFWDDAGSGMREHDIEDMWHEWLEETEQVELVKKFSNLAGSIDYLIERVNEPGFNRVVIRDPGNSSNFLMLGREFADKVLVLGDVP